jgi:hypothetical protein
MRLLKLILAGAIGYALYEIYLGIREGSGGKKIARGAQRDLRRAMNEDEGRMANFTGTGRGTTVSSSDTDGASIKHVVGRGVVSN